METIWDWLTVFVFAGLVALMLHRSSQDRPPDRLIQYLVPAAGCAIANYIGNNYSDVAAAIALALVGVYLVVVLKVRLPASSKGPDERD